MSIKKKTVQSGFILSVLLIQSSIAQTVDFDLIDYYGLSFTSSRKEITKKLGNPTREYAPNYDCGFLSSDEQGIPYITLDYKTIKFTGTAKIDYLIEEINFEIDSNIQLSYGEYVLDYNTTICDLINIFGDKLVKHLPPKFTGGIVIFHATNDEGVRIVLKNGKLLKWQYYSSC